MKNNIQIHIRTSKELKEVLEKKAELERCSVSDIIRIALNKYLYKDVDYKNQLQATIESLRSEQKKTGKEISLFSSLFAFWTRYYFTLTQGLDTLSPEAKKTRVKVGELQTQTMLKSFRGEMQNTRPGLIEALVADYIVQDGVQNNTEIME